MEISRLHKLESIREICKRDLPQLAFWPAYYDRRFYEFLSYTESFPKNHFEKALEIGCGNGFGAALLSQFADQVVATDIDDSQIEPHVGGLNKAKKLIEHLGIDNVTMQTAANEALPFPDNSFDFVFSSHVMIYLKDSKKALAEIERVLKPGGYYFCVVPTRATTLYRLVKFQFYIVERILHHVFWKRLHKTENNKENSSSINVKKYSALKDFPFPPSYGGLPHWRDEFREWSKDYWRTKILASGRLKLLSQVSTQINPLVPIFGDRFHELSARIYAVSWKTDVKLGMFRFFQCFAVNTVLVTQKL